MASTNFTSGTVIASSWLNDVDDWTFGLKGFASGDGVTNEYTQIVAADVAAAAAGKALFVPPGTFLIGTSYIFTAPVVMYPGAKFKTSSSSVYLKFSAGFECGLYYCLDTDGPTQFFKTDGIRPQWFGATGLYTDNDSVAMTRACRATMGCMPAIATPNAMPGSDYPCNIIRFAGPATHRIQSVPLYCGTSFEFDGDAGSPNGCSIVQIGVVGVAPTEPAFYVCPVNIGLDGTTVINDGVGINYINGGKYYSQVQAQASEGAPIFRFLSPAQAYTQLGIAGTAGTVGHVDTVFRNIWALNCNTFAKCDAGALWVHFEDCQFDVVIRCIAHTGTSFGAVWMNSPRVYQAIWGAVFCSTSDTTTGYRLQIEGGYIKGGLVYSADADQRRAINVVPSAMGPSSSYVLINGTTFERSTSGINRLGGPIFVKNVDTVRLDVLMNDADSTNDQKFIAIQDGVKHLAIRGTLISRTLTNYTNSAAIQFSQSTQTLQDIQLDVSIANENASAIALAVGSNFVVTGVDMDRVLMTGNFTAASNSNISGKTRQLTTIASSATVALPPGGEVFVISGTTSITSVTATGWAGRSVRLIFQGALTFTDGSNLKLAGNLVTTADDTISLVCDGTNWYETGRSVN